MLTSKFLVKHSILPVIFEDRLQKNLLSSQFLKYDFVNLEGWVT